MNKLFYNSAESVSKIFLGFGFCLFVLASFFFFLGSVGGVGVSVECGRNWIFAVPHECTLIAILH